MSRIAYIYKNPLFSTASNKGISQFYDEVEVVANGEESDSPNAVRIVRRVLGGRVLFHAEPIHKPAGAVGPMAGGSAIAIDALGAYLYPEYPEIEHFYGLIKLHDRFETPAEYEKYSR